MNAAAWVARAAPEADGAAVAALDTGAGGGPFDLDDSAAYARWRAWKLRHRAHEAADLRVDLADPRALSEAERALLLQRIARHGVAWYRSPRREADPQLPRRLGAQLGLTRLDANWLADEDGISRIAVHAVPPAGGPPRADFIPYTDRAIGWHTDGYYHPEARRILGMILHCVQPAAAGGETGVLDPELVYIALRDAAPALVRALMHPQAMVIPARGDGQGVARAAQAGPVFSLVPQAGGPRLHMRYTARTRSIEWRDDALTREAVAFLVALMRPGAGGLAPDIGGPLRLRLEPGTGLVGHNVLHERSAFADDPAAPRLLYRARYLDRVAAPLEDAWREAPDDPAGAAAPGMRRPQWPSG